jgi:hypothetical protein
VLIDGGGGNKILLAERSFDEPAFEVPVGAVPLNGAGRAGKAGACVTLDSLFNGKRELAVGGGHDRSRQVVGHVVDDTAARPTSRRLSPAGRDTKEEASSLTGNFFAVSGIGGSPDQK